MQNPANLYNRDLIHQTKAAIKIWLYESVRHHAESNGLFYPYRCEHCEPDDFCERITCPNFDVQTVRCRSHCLNSENDEQFTDGLCIQLKKIAHCIRTKYARKNLKKIEEKRSQ